MAIKVSIQAASHTFATLCTSQGGRLYLQSTSNKWSLRFDPEVFGSIEAGEQVILNIAFFKNKQVEVPDEAPGLIKPPGLIVP